MISPTSIEGKRKLGMPGGPVQDIEEEHAEHNGGVHKPRDVVLKTSHVPARPDFVFQ